MIFSTDFKISELINFQKCWHWYVFINHLPTFQDMSQDMQPEIPKEFFKTFRKVFRLENNKNITQQNEM